MIKVAGKNFPQIGIERIRSRENGARVYQYILDRSKIVGKLRESGLDDIEEFSSSGDASQADIPENEDTIFEVLVISSKLTTGKPFTSERKKATPHNVASDSAVGKETQAEIPIASTSGTSGIDEPAKSAVANSETEDEPSQTP
jgi:hypothetical protein